MPNPTSEPPDVAAIRAVYRLPTYTFEDAERDIAALLDALEAARVHADTLAWDIDTLAQDRSLRDAQLAAEQDTQRERADRAEQALAVAREVIERMVGVLRIGSPNLAEELRQVLAALAGPPP